MKKIRYFFEYIALAVLMGLFRLMSPEQASALAGKIGRTIGPRLAASRKAIANLKAALPGKTEDECQAAITGMWENMARVIAEYPNLESLSSKAEITGLAHLKKALEENGQVIVFSGHLANWEIMAPCLLRQGIATDLVYRAPNNPWSDKMLDRYRSLRGKLRTLPKSKKGTRRLVESIKNGRSVGILIDQKYNEGLEIPFFGRPAMTSPAFVQLAQKFNCGLVPFRVERLKGTQFRLSFFPAMKIFDDQAAPLPVEQVMMNAHQLLESWIIERPEEWLWLHRRWG
ncbi:MAG: lysophospholipid acyltransferase family protein [Micavibrio sp.]